MGQANDSPSTEFFKHFITDYGQAWDNYDLQTILDYYYTPCFIFKAGKVYNHLSEEAKTRYFHDLLEVYHQTVIRAETPTVK